MQQSEKMPEEVGSRLSDFKIIKELGKGSYGTVYTVKSNINSNIYVMKKIELNHLNPRQQIECHREVSILKKVNHKNIIKYYSSFLEKEILYIIMEYAELGDLYSLIKHYKKHSKFFSENDLWKISFEVLSGLDYLHSHNIIHRDIKCLNLFITKDRHIKIGDLGVSAWTSSVDNLHYTRVGTPLYISPELVKQKPYNYKTDIWSFGCSLYHLASLDPPFTGGNLIVLGNNIVKGVPKALPNQYSNEFKSFVDKMLEKKADKRPSAKEALDFIPTDVLNDMKIKGEKIVIKSKRPFSSAIFVNNSNKGNKVITVNKEEIKNIFGDENSNIKNSNDNNINKNIDENSNNKNIERKTDSNVNEKQNSNKEILINQNKHNKKEIKQKYKSEDKNKIWGRNKENEENNLAFINNINLICYNESKDSKRETEIIEDKKPIKKKIYDLSFNIPSFNNQKGFNNFRKRQNKKNNYIFEKNLIGLTLSNKLGNLGENNLKVFSPFRKENTSMSKQSLKKYLQQNFIEKNKIKKNQNKEEHDDIKPINTEVKNINIININSNNNEPKKEDKKSEKNNNILHRLNTDTNQYLSINKIKFPEVNNKIKNNNIKEINIDINNNNVYNNITNLNKPKNKRLTSAKALPLRPLTSKLTKNIINFNKKLYFNNNTFHNNINLINTKANLNTETNRINTEKQSKKSYRPMTGFHPQINNNVMNININFYNIDMNKRFLIPEMNPYNQDDINKKNGIEEILMETKKFKSNANILSDFELDKYKNSNEFLFQKIIKSIKEINGNNKRLTINDLV